MSSRILGIGGLDHNASITCIESGHLVSFLELERPRRRKNLLCDRLDVRHGHRDRREWSID